TGGPGGTGAGGAGGTIKLFGTSLSAASASVNTTGGTGAQVGGDGILIVGSNTPGGAPGFQTGTQTVAAAGMVGANPYIAGAPTTPLIAGLEGGAEVYGLVPLGSLLTSLEGSDAVKKAVANAPSDALVAVVREAIPTGFAQYSGYDLVLYVNLTGNALASPTLGVVAPGTGPNFESALQIGGVANNAAFGGTGAPQVITGLPANAIWATLVPTAAAESVNASLGGAVVPVAGQPLASGAFAYITVQRAFDPSAYAVPGLQALAVSPDGKDVYAVNTAQSTLVVANAADLSQRETFLGGAAGVAGLGGADAVVVSPDGTSVYVAGATDHLIAEFARDAATGDLTFPRSYAETGSANDYGALANDPNGGHLYAAGADGVVAFARAADGGLTQTGAATNPGGFGGFVGLAASHDGHYVYAVSATGSALVVLNAADLSVVTTLSGATDGLEGASSIAVSPDDQSLYVTGEGGGTLAVIGRQGNTLGPIQVLQDGVNGARGLLGADGVAVSSDGQFVYVTSGQENSLAVYGPGNGGLVLEQVIRGTLGLDQPSALAVGGGPAGVVFVASEAGVGTSPGGLASFSPVTPGRQPKPSTLVIGYQSMNSLDLTLGSADNLVKETKAATVATLTIESGDGANAVNLQDPAGTTTVGLGNGNNQVSAYPTAAGLNLAIVVGDGQNFVMLDSAAAGDGIGITLGTGTNTAQIEGTQLDPTSRVTLTGNTGYDTLLFDAAGKPILPSVPTLPDGTIQVDPPYGVVTYTQISNIPGFVGATVSAGGPYAVVEGQSLDLLGTVTPATNSTILNESWDLQGDGVYGDATGLSPTLTWAQLVALGLGHP
ncbi:MAG: lactonase family protein, partial [Planctomycetia bacterium]|nr:lactonase family protein [Planctomycetia bacterium]